MASAEPETIMLRTLTEGVPDTTQEPASNTVSQFPNCPNGGKAWLKVGGSWLIFMNTYGIASPSAISWIGTTLVCLLGFTGILAGPLYDSGYIRSLLAFGGFLVVFGFFMLSLASGYFHIVLSQGVCIGSGLLYVPGVSIVSNAFTTKRPIATGIAATGSAVGGVLFPILFRNLEPRMGFPWVNRIFGILVLVTSLFALILLRPDPIPNLARRRGGELLDSSALNDIPYLFFCLGLFFVELGYWIPPFIVAPTPSSLGTSADFAFYLLAYMNAGSLAGRILPAWIAQVRTIGPVWVLIVGCLSLGALILGWIGIRDVTGITIWGVSVGFMSGIAVALPNAVVPRLAPYANVVGARTGMVWCFVAFAALIGAPIAGVLVDTATNDYSRGQHFSGLSICLEAALLCVPAVHVARRKEE
ncbi:Fujikurins efflux protein [Colletotrichum gloeosporioides]|uniref:Fujikurins efflux protein n=1 Tax=Colletotrichum gloeosporioides TaxID=474922 RepID=A0A8H4CXC1_COLGL|nr:Fujikurins efflux protein [Colletotrichum gloeosporioides]KAF3811710.1 Fujikurins efflux protein [Colletotrichum gloeosporioides]